MLILRQPQPSAADCQKPLVIRPLSIDPCQRLTHVEVRELSGHAGVYGCLGVWECACGWTEMDGGWGVGRMPSAEALRHIRLSPTASHPHAVFGVESTVDPRS